MSSCIVTCFYPLQSKYPVNKYLKWIDTFMNTIENDTIIFTNQDVLYYLNNTYVNSENKSYSHIRVIIKDFNELYYYQYKEIFEQQYELDDQKDCGRNPFLYLLWYNKLKFVEQVYNLYGDKYDNFVWCDIGCMREMDNSMYNHRKNFCKNIKKLDKVTCLYLPKTFFSPTIGGTIIGIPKNKIEELISLQDSIFSEFSSKKETMFFGCDQICYKYMVQKKPELFDLICVPSDFIGNEWFYLLNYFSTTQLDWDKIINQYYTGKKYETITPLCHIMKKYGSDKGLGWHNYTTFYDYIFSYIDKFQSMNIFELGLGTNNINIPSNMGVTGKPGASLYGWREYFITSQIFGADIDKNILFTDARLKTFYCDQKNSNDIHSLFQNISSSVDIIIEDGLHEIEANLIFLENSIQYLKKNGIYICEDLLFSTIEKFEPLLDSLQNKYNLQFIKIIKIPHSINIHDNNLLFIVK